MYRIIITLLLAVFTFNCAEAQLFKKIKNETERKIKQKAEQKIVDELSEELARRAMKPLDKAFDDMFKKDYKDKYGKDYDDSEYDGDPDARAAHMNAMLNAMYGDVELPEEYRFEYTIEIEVTDFGEKKANKIKMLVNPSSGAFGMEQKEGKNDQIMVFDIEKDQVVIFNKKEKTAMAVPNVMKMASVYGQGSGDDFNSTILRFEKINQTKKVLDYMCQGYIMETEEYKSTFFITDKLPFDWAETMGSFAKNISPNFKSNSSKYPKNGMLMFGTTTHKEKGNESQWEVTKISKKTYKIKCKDYELQNMMAGG